MSRRRVHPASSALSVHGFLAITSLSNLGQIPASHGHLTRPALGPPVAWQCSQESRGSHPPSSHHSDRITGIQPLHRPARHTHNQGGQLGPADHTHTDKVSEAHSFQRTLCASVPPAGHPPRGLCPTVRLEPAASAASPPKSPGDRVSSKAQVPSLRLGGKDPPFAICSSYASSPLRACLHERHLPGLRVVRTTLAPLLPGTDDQHSSWPSH